jgi:hypothetical protein
MAGGVVLSRSTRAGDRSGVSGGAGQKAMSRAGGSTAPFSSQSLTPLRSAAAPQGDQAVDQRMRVLRKQFATLPVLDFKANPAQLATLRHLIADPKLYVKDGIQAGYKPQAVAQSARIVNGKPVNITARREDGPSGSYNLEAGESANSRSYQSAVSTTASKFPNQSEPWVTWFSAPADTRPILEMYSWLVELLTAASLTEIGAARIVAKNLFVGMFGVDPDAKPTASPR